MGIQPVPLKMYGEGVDQRALEWSFVDEQLRDAGTYWITARAAGHPHPRPVWGVWHEARLHLSIGSLVVAREGPPTRP